MSRLELKAAIGEHPYLDSLWDGGLRAEGFDLVIEPIVGTLRNSMTRMVREAALDLCEMSPTSFLMAREAGAPLVALPVFTYRMFPMHLLVVRDDATLNSPTDLVGVSVAARTWAQPTGLWLREIARSWWEVDPASWAWSFVNDDPVSGLARPAGYRDRRGFTLTELLATGEVDVALGSPDAPPGCRRLMPDPDSEARAWFTARGIVPANHVLVLREDLAQRVDLGEVYALFDQAKQAYMNSGRSDDAAIEQVRRISELRDPMVNGWTANKVMWKELVTAMVSQGMLASPRDSGSAILPID